ncbi:uncharacterized protein LOC129602073 [Paramacrobiotus metropolitanus]|uniref:uncharacterized protein LOC129602073 n=1 Tax=Paramacrobiotus metropolitanus TaxID=2943436 RepID=UPI0024460ABB|nr:uncharacterized protein LOC129602073 [Paramacrobiotus metropolitanus]
MTSRRPQCGYCGITGQEYLILCEEAACGKYFCNGNRDNLTRSHVLTHIATTHHAAISFYYGCATGPASNPSTAGAQTGRFRPKCDGCGSREIFDLGYDGREDLCIPELVTCREHAGAGAKNHWKPYVEAVQTIKTRSRRPEDLTHYRLTADLLKKKEDGALAPEKARVSDAEQQEELSLPGIPSISSDERESSFEELPTPSRSVSRAADGNQAGAGGTPVTGPSRAPTKQTVIVSLEMESLSSSPVAQRRKAAPRAGTSRTASGVLRGATANQKRRRVLDDSALTLLNSREGSENSNRRAAVVSPMDEFQFGGRLVGVVRLKNGATDDAALDGHSEKMKAEDHQPKISITVTRNGIHIFEDPGEMEAFTHPGPEIRRIWRDKASLHSFGYVCGNQFYVIKTAKSSDSVVGAIHRLLPSAFLGTQNVVQAGQHANAGNPVAMANENVQDGSVRGVSGTPPSRVSSQPNETLGSVEDEETGNELGADDVWQDEDDVGSADQTPSSQLSSAGMKRGLTRRRYEMRPHRKYKRARASTPLEASWWFSFRMVPLLYACIFKHIMTRGY